MNQGSGVAITGSNRGLGLALAEAFSEIGSKLILHVRSHDHIAPLQEKFQIKENQFFVGDLREPATIESFSKVFSEHKGSILINNACIHCPSQSIGEISNAMIEDLVEVNLIAPMKLTRKAVQCCVDKPLTIVNINSMVGIEPKRLRSVYGASKAGLKAFSDSLRIEFSEKHLTNVLNVFLSRVRSREDFTEGMIPSRVAKRIVEHVCSGSDADLTIDGRKDKSFEM